MAEGQSVLDHLVEVGFLAVDGDLGFVGDAFERHFGRRNFMDLTAVFTVEPQLTVTVGRKEIGTISPLALGSKDQPGPALLGLAGRSWRITNVDWRQRVVSVVEESGASRSTWLASGLDVGLSVELAQAIRGVLLGADLDVDVSRRARHQLDVIRDERAGEVDSDGPMLERDGDQTRLWTFAGGAANRSLAAALGELGVDARADSFTVRAESRVDMQQIRSCADLLQRSEPPVPPIRQEVLDGLKFSVALPADLTKKTLAERLTDPVTAAEVCLRPWTVVGR